MSEPETKGSFIESDYTRCPEVCRHNIVVTDWRSCSVNKRNVRCLGTSRWSNKNGVKKTKQLTHTMSAPNKQKLSLLWKLGSTHASEVQSRTGWWNVSGWLYMFRLYLSPLSPALLTIFFDSLPRDPVHAKFRRRSSLRVSFLCKQTGRSISFPYPIPSAPHYLLVTSGDSFCSRRSTFFYSLLRIVAQNGDYPLDSNVRWKFRDEK